MSIDERLRDLARRRIKVRVVGDQLLVEDPLRLLTPEDEAFLRGQKLAIVARCRARAGDAWVTDTPRSVTEAPADGPILVNLANVQPVEVEWVRPQRWAKRSLSLVVGDPGFGKTFLTLDAAARFSTGGLWPEGGRAPLGNVVLLAAEDGLEETIVPRLNAMEADLSKIHVLKAIRRRGKERIFSLATDLPCLEAAIRQLQPVAVFIDPLTAYLGGADSKMDADVRGLLAPLAKLGHDCDVAVIAVMHLNKGPLKALYRVGGSIAFVAAARSVFAVVPDPDADDPTAPSTRRFFVAVKMNLALKPLPLAFTIDGPDGQARPKWVTDPLPHIDVEAAMRGPALEVDTTDTRKGLADAVQFLQQLLEDGPKPYSDIVGARKAAGISERTLERAKARLGVRSQKAGFSGKWEWVLPETSLEGGPAPSPSGTLAAFAPRESETADEPNPSPKGAIPEDVAPLGGPLAPFEGCQSSRKGADGAVAAPFDESAENTGESVPIASKVAKDAN